MSKNNKVNRDHYTQRGRLTPDDAARELSKQRESASPKKVEGSKFGEPAVAAVQGAKNAEKRVTGKDKTREDVEDTE